MEMLILIHNKLNVHKNLYQDYIFPYHNSKERAEESLGQKHSHTVLKSSVNQYHPCGKQADKTYQNYNVHTSLT